MSENQLPSTNNEVPEDPGLSPHHQHPESNYVQSPEDDAEESAAFLRVVNTFRFYKVDGCEQIRRQLASYCRIPRRHQQILNDFPTILKRRRRCVSKNYQFIEQILSKIDGMFGFSVNTMEPIEQISAPPEFQLDKMRSTIKQFVRDWSEEGKIERDQCYKPIIAEILEVVYNLIPFSRFLFNLNLLLGLSEPRWSENCGSWRRSRSFGPRIRPPGL